MKISRRWINADMIGSTTRTANPGVTGHSSGGGAPPRSPKCHFHGKGRIERVVPGDDVLIADYLIEFEIVDMPGWSPFRSVRINSC